ncbi:MAG: xanthine dehydrogenase family protein molybdopterin-binding subunit [Rhodospirillales bacterium]
MASYIGTATSRVDGRAKVTGAAKYAAEFNQAGLAHAALVTATITRGRIADLDTGAAKRLPGVLEVLTHLNRPPLPDDDAAYSDQVAPDGTPFRPLYDDQVHFNFQPIAVVVAETAEIARHAASLVRVRYAQEPHVTDLDKQRGAAFDLPKGASIPESNPRGDAAGALAAAAVRHEAEYVIPPEHHNPMELYATTVIRDGGGRLTVYDKTQGVQNVHGHLCGVFGLKPEDVRVLNPYMGGGFGSGLRPQFNVLLAVLAARALQRSVRLVLTRQQMYGLGFRPETIERIALGATADGTLTAITHEAIAMTSRNEAFARNDTTWSAMLYRCANTAFTHKLARLDISTPCDMRAPGATTGVHALECAMDELAVALKIDPVELRLRNYSDRDQNIDAPYTSKALRECYRQGAATFGWERRSAAPRSMREGNELVGWGMANGIWEALDTNLTVRVALTANGHAEVTCATADIGTGTYTVMTQVAAEMLGLPLENVTARLGDSTLPPSPVEGGSWTASSVANAIAAAALEIRGEILRHARGMPGSPLAGVAVADTVLADGRIASRADPGRAVPIADAMRHGSADRIVRDGVSAPKEDHRFARNTHSAIFVEVRIDEQLGVVRIPRLVSAVAAGRIINPKTARSQILGSVVMGIGMALHEETAFDHRYGRIVNADFAEYHVPVHADVQGIEVIFVDEPDTEINALGTKGVGEIGIVGVAAAIANAVFHATGKRVRRLPITLDKLLG